MFTIFLFALCVSAISFTISVTSIFQWLRDLLSQFHKKAEELIHCPWCLSFYISSFFLVFSSNNELIVHVTNFLPVDFFITVFAVMTISGLCHYVLLRAYEPILKMQVQRKIEKIQAEKAKEKILLKD